MISGAIGQGFVTIKIVHMITEFLNQVFNEECLSGIGRMPDKCVDMILCDLPYGITANKWDKVIKPSLLFKQYWRVIKENGAIVLTAQQPFATDLIVAARKYFRYELIWHKSLCCGFLNANKMPLRKHENILVFYRKLPTYNPQKTGEKREVTYKRQQGSKCKNYSPTKAYVMKSDGTKHPGSVLEVPNSNHKSLHPTQKPLPLFAWFVRSYTNPGDIILDNCMGSGTTAIACLQEGRHFVGFEMDSEIHKVCVDRIAAYGK